MQINKNSWHYKLWKKSFDYAVPETTDLCRYSHRVFWQVLGITMMVLAGIAAVGCCLVTLWLLAYRGFWLNTDITLKIVGVVACIGGTIALYIKWLYSNRKPIQEQGLTSNWLHARKQKVCPLVEFTKK